MAKTNSGLVEYCKAKIGCYYWFGTFGQMASKTLYTQKSKQYPNKYTASDFEKQIANPKQVFDCSGLIKAYLWTKSIDDTKPKYDAKTDYGATAFYDNSTYKGKISVFPKKPGMLVFKGTSKTKSHVGVYIGNDTVVEAKGHKYGVVETKFSTGDWDYWAQCNLITDDTDVKPEPQPTPAPTPAPEPKNDNKYIVDPDKVHSCLNVRSGPGMGYKVVGHLLPKTKDGGPTVVTVIKTNGSWSAIGVDRWVSSNYIKKI